MPVASTGAQQAQAERDAGEPGAQVAVVAGVPDLDGVQALTLEALEERAGAPLLEVGHRDHPTDAVHHLGDLAEGGQDLLHEGGTAPPDVAVERVGDVDGPALPDDGPRNMRPSHGAAPGLPQDVIEVERDAEVLQSGDHL